ncbi:hypothetical protein [Winogradskyella sp.]|uniref:glucosamine inositolphosphorylceramide transferase family protein n=1 Tax=Winogradskyella sp. TaxID=1883156 RepID=UPI002618CB44|nr:hypothetical protein [Winogradskyella sp.]
MNYKTKKLKVAIIINKPSFFNWQKEIVDYVKNSSSLELALCINNLDVKTPKKIPLLWKVFLKLDNRFFNPSPYALSKYDFGTYFKDVPLIDYSNGINNKQLNDFDIDVVVNLIDSDLPKALLKTSKYGIWFLTHCDLDNVGKKPYGIWEMISKKPESVAVLRYIKNNMHYPATIDKTSSCTDGLSYKRNINSLLWQSHMLVINNLNLLATNKYLFEKKLDTHKEVFANKEMDVSYQPPNNFKTLKYVLSLYFKKLAQLLQSMFYFNQWALIFLNSNGEKNPYNLKDYKTVLPPKDRFWADPFLIKENGKCYLFIEELIYKNKLGHLSVMEIDENGIYTKPKKILEKDYHLSYPFVFKDNDEYYMIPETSGNKDIQLYKAINFPLDWELQETLMDNVVAVDTTIYKKDDTYWMFTSQRNHKGASKNVELFLYSSKHLISNNWKPHPLNPIIRDVKTARPAGGFFIRDNKLFRPSQDCSHHYGYGLNILEIIKLTENDYEERLELKMIPNWDKKINSTHTLNSVNDIFISDVKLKRNRFF